MADPMQLNVVDAQNTKTIQLDGPQATGRIGSSSRAGSLIITSPIGQEAIYLNGRDASLTVGGEAGYGGKLTIKDGQNQPVIYFDSANGDFIFGNADAHGSLRMSGPGNTDSVRMDGTTGNVIAGSSGVNGAVMVNGLAGVRVSLGGAEGIGTFFDAAGAAAIQILPEAGKIVVNGQDVPDYVFEPAYRLKPLSELQLFVETNHHLPGMPAAKEAAAGGLDLVGLSLQLLKTVEELTLHVIALNGRLEAIEADKRTD